MEAAVPIVFGVDVEPDTRPTTATEPMGLDGFARCVEWLDALVVRSDLPLTAQMAYAMPIMEALVRRPFARRLRVTGPIEVVAELPPRHEDAVP